MYKQTIKFPQPNQMFYKELNDYALRPNSSKVYSQLTTGRSFEDIQDYPEKRTYSFDYEKQLTVMSRTSSDVQASLKQNIFAHQTPLIQPVQKSCLFFNNPMNPLKQQMCQSTTSSRDIKIIKSFNSITEENESQTPKATLKSTEEFGTKTPKADLKRKKSLIILESDADETNQMKTLKNIKHEKEPFEFFEMTSFQQKIWQRLVGLPQEQIMQACQLEILINAPHEEYEMTIDISNIPYNWSVVELANLINQVFSKQKDSTMIKNPQLSMLTGRIKTQRLDHSMKTFELINLIVNGIKLIVLEDIR